MGISNKGLSGLSFFFFIKEWDYTDTVMAVYGWKANLVG